MQLIARKTVLSLPDKLQTFGASLHAGYFEFTHGILIRLQCRKTQKASIYWLMFIALGLQYTDQCMPNMYKCYCLSQYRLLAVDHLLPCICPWALVSDGSGWPASQLYELV